MRDRNSHPTLEPHSTMPSRDARVDTLRADEHAAFNSEHRAIAAPPMTDPFDAPHSTLVTDRSWAFARESRLSHLALAR